MSTASKHAPPRSAALPPGFPDLPGFVALLVASTFEELEIGVSSCAAGVWRALHQALGVAVTEVECGADQLRYRHNLKCLARAGSTRRPVRGELFGLHDLYVPVLKNNEVQTILVAGPIALDWPTRDDIHERWFQMTRARARPSDAAFGRYLEATLGTLTLEGALFGAFERLLACFAELASGEGDMNALVTEAEELKQKLMRARSPNRMWDAARSMVDESTSHTWSTFLMADPLAELGMKRAPRHVVVGLLARKGLDTDPVGDTLARAAFQRACVAFAQKHGHLVSGQVGDRGVTLLPDHAENGPRARSGVVELVTRITALARRFGFRFHAGIGLEHKPASLAARFRAALAAAEKALSRGVALEFAETKADRSRENLRHLRTSLGENIAAHPSHLSARFGLYVEAVLAHSGYRLETARGDLQSGLERLAQPFLATGVLDAKSFDEICRTVEGDREADTLLELIGAYRRIVSDIERAVETPTAARQERSTRRALRFIHENLAQPLSRAQVARVAGIEANYFSRLLKREQGVSFEGYVQKQRLERARHLLRGTRLDISRIAQLSGFQSRTYFQRLFKQTTGMTPVEFREG